jgi:AmmeMemoRadiSam system protein A
MTASSLDPSERRILLDVAGRSIRHGLDSGSPLKVVPADYPPALQAQRASFVTLHLEGELRGCIGHLEAVEPLVSDVADNAFSAAFKDPRFPALREAELAGMQIHISVLTPAEPMQFSSEADLLRQLRPGVDGLILEDGWARGTFLPSVWESLPEPRAFLAHLKRKAGLPMSHWSDRLRFYRYTTESFS